MSFKPSSEEQKWAKIKDVDVKRQIKEKIEEENKEAVFDTLLIECPNDKTLLETLELDGTGISISKCSFCGGIWIDRINIERLFQSSKKSESLLTYLAKILNIEISEI